MNLNKVWQTVGESGGEISPERAKEDERAWPNSLLIQNDPVSQTQINEPAPHCLWDREKI